MPPDFDKWLSAPLEALADAPRAVDAWRRISDKPSALEVIRSGVKQPAQTVRIEIGSAQPRNAESAGTGSAGVQQMTVFGVRGHPTVADTDIRRGDRVIVDNQEYSIYMVIKTVGEVQALGEVRR